MTNVIAMACEQDHVLAVHDLVYIMAVENDIVKHVGNGEVRNLGGPRAKHHGQPIPEGILQVLLTECLDDSYPMYHPHTNCTPPKTLLKEVGVHLILWPKASLRYRPRSPIAPLRCYGSAVRK